MDIYDIILKILKPRRVYVRRRRTRQKSTRALYLLHKESARILIDKKLAEFNLHYNFVYKRVSIRNQKTRWGSCSKKGNLNFTYRLALLPEKLVDYIIVHELCHLGQFNHSRDFWNLVAETIPDHKSRRQELKKIDL